MKRGMGISLSQSVSQSVAIVQLVRGNIVASKRLRKQQTVEQAGTHASKQGDRYQKEKTTFWTFCVGE